MTETEDEVKPLFKSGGSSAEFICNINGEVSLWRIGKGFGSSIRAYTEDYNGTWLDDLKDHEVHIKKLEAFPKFYEHADTLRRNIDVIKLYGAMLQETRSGVG
jgi:hypothetical protein